MMHDRPTCFCYSLLAVVVVLWAQILSAEDLANTPGPIFNPETYKGKPLLLLLFSIDDPRTATTMSLMKDLFALRREFNLEIVAVCLNTGRNQDLQQFLSAHQPPFPVFLDANGKLAESLKIKSGLGLVIYDKDGKLIATKDALPAPGQPDLATSWKSFINRFVKIGYTPEDAPLLGYKPPVPLFEATALNGARICVKEIYPKKPVVILIFSPSCSHCQHELDFLHGLYTGQEFKNKFEIIAISRGTQSATETMIKNKGYTFPVLLDGDGTISSLFPSFIGSVPLSYFIDREGHINYQHTGFSEYTADNCLMELRKLCSLPNPPRLNPTGYSGHERCMVCHEREHVQWSLSRHADAFLSLVRKGSERDPACVACHVTGYEQAGGYRLNDPKTSRHLEGVQCESCHGPGYQSCAAFTGTKTPKRTREQWEALCVNCHTAKESLNFKFASRFPKVLHTSAPNLTALSRKEREALLRTYRKKKNLFDNPAAYVGAETCKTCHAEQYQQWQTTAHATAHTTAKARTAPPDKLYRYYTGVEEQGNKPDPGYPGVQCEACHGPGERHTKEPDKKGHEYIVSLGKECSSCVVEQICRACHGSADDPNFDFNLYFPKIRHAGQHKSK